MLLLDEKRLKTNELSIQLKKLGRTQQQKTQIQSEKGNDTGINENSTNTEINIVKS